MRNSLDCPVPRLTLLFFGAAKDVPEAAKTVTAGTACLHFEMHANGQTWPGFQAALTTPDEVHHQRNHRDD
jgi:hypothetical protein